MNAGQLRFAHEKPKHNAVYNSLDYFDGERVANAASLEETTHTSDPRKSIMKKTDVLWWWYMKENRVVSSCVYGARVACTERATGRHQHGYMGSNEDVPNFSRSCDFEQGTNLYHRIDKKFAAKIDREKKNWSKVFTVHRTTDAMAPIHLPIEVNTPC